LDEDATPPEETGPSNVGHDEAPNSGQEPPTTPEDATSPGFDGAGSGGEGPLPHRRALGRCEALERLDRQWEDRTPLHEMARPITALVLTTDDDPRGWDYIGALVGSPPDETARACASWLEAQLAADAISLGRAVRPRVDLVPAGRLWFVVRTVADMIIVIDGPGFLTPIAAALAASRRYQAGLLQALRAADGTTADPESNEDNAIDDQSASADDDPPTPTADAQDDGE
jgi:hypothetical protein